MTYLSGFRNTHSSEEASGLLPHNQNSPQVCAENLYAEQLSGSAFTRSRSHNLRSWLYRHLPSVVKGDYVLDSKLSANLNLQSAYNEPNQIRWLPLEIDKAKHNFFHGLKPLLTNGSLNSAGCIIYLYTANTNMQGEAICNADGEMLIVPQIGNLEVRTEFGLLELSPTEVLVIPRGVHFQIHTTTDARGYVIENHGSPFELPNLGPIGANGLACPRHFLAPHAATEDGEDYKVYHKYQNEIYTCALKHSPFNVRAWWGNYYPYKYDLKLFNTVNTVSFDHPDPSIFTVLTSPSGMEGVANIDFVIFPERWMVAEHSFRPPYYHKNIMSEYMGLVHGSYDAKEGGFIPGGGSLHNQMSPHGPDANTFKQATKAELKPQKYASTLAFMFESYLPFKVIKDTSGKLKVDEKYRDCWQGLK